MPDYRDRHVVVTGGTGALGNAVVSGLLEAGAICHVPYRSESETGPLRQGGQGAALSCCPSPIWPMRRRWRKFYDGLPGLWASIHIAGGFAFAPIADSPKALLMAAARA